MTIERVTLDTNILFYSFDRQAGARHATAIKVIEHALKLDSVITLQALSEFYHAVTRKSVVSPDIASEQVADWQTLFPVATAKSHTLTRTMSLVSQHSIAFWDALLLETAREAGTTILVSEDFQHERSIDGIRIINPFISEEYFSL